MRPELGRADVSGFAKGGAAIGAGILQGIENYREQKQITASALADLEGRFAADPGLLETASQAGGNIGKSFKKVFEEGDFNQRDVLNLSGYVNSLQSTQAAAQQSRLREAQLTALKIGKTQAELDKEAAELARTQAMTEKTKAETAAMGKPKPLTQSERMRLIESKVGDVTFGQYLQELKQTKKIKGGKLHQRGLFNLDEKQIAAFDDAILNNPEFLRDMPQAVKDYYSSMGSKPMVMTLGDGTIAEVNPQ